MSIFLLGDFCGGGRLDARELWRPSGQFVLNLEGAICDKMPTAFEKIAIRTPPDFWRDYCEIGAPVAVSLANNHVLDYGEAGLVETMRHLAAQNVVAFGIDRPDLGVKRTLTLEICGIRYGLAAYCDISTIEGISRSCASDFGLSLLDDDIVRADASQLQTSCDVRIAYVHWGDEEVSTANVRQVEAAHRLLAAGFTHVVGHHGHIIQDAGHCASEGIWYGVGNYAMADVISPTLTKIQASWNRKGLCVEIGASARAFTFALTATGVLRKWRAFVEMPPQSQCLSRVGPAAMARRHKRAALFGVTRSAISQLVLQRRLPHASGVMSFARYLASSSLRMIK